ncbi:MULTISPECIES: SURF1 family protein [unclassified Polaromonas]|uniref:SURF1 family protein n=1 Tax=unclassified Polaromonas TaxID=2638319 RepID=UPI0018C95A53|nr:MULTISPECIES: SURF1 family protein [unclassified Polaromonas]MBG6071965.1 surfeit locus 1 family protein [Polaromonas sp. CG_9.7]MBG6113967.1 surfeit locus 1 family protein [Polaromonas sp. CG_9.2]MDH6183885.1 surfeit locus 1 family protein [Polaromonas sp. CG_23.6]
MTSVLRSRNFWILTLAALVTAGGTFSLGEWQLRRAAQKEAVQTAINDKNSLSALDGRSLLATKNIADEIYRQAVLQGVWQAANTVYLDNRPMDGRSGFWVMTPLVLEGTGQAILVQRGWAPRDFADRSRLPPVTTPEGVVTVQGRIAPPTSKLYEFKGADTGPIRQNLDMAAFRTETGLPLFEQASLLQTGAPSEGLLREWAAPNLGVDKHYGYAFQWFGLCVLVVVLYGWYQIFLPFRASLRAQRGD